MSNWVMAICGVLNVAHRTFTRFFFDCATDHWHIGKIHSYVHLLAFRKATFWLHKTFFAILRLFRRCYGGRKSRFREHGPTLLVSSQPLCNQYKLPALNFRDPPYACPKRGFPTSHFQDCRHKVDLHATSLRHWGTTLTSLSLLLYPCTHATIVECDHSYQHPSKEEFMAPTIRRELSDDVE